MGTGRLLFVVDDGAHRARVTPAGDRPGLTVNQTVTLNHVFDRFTPSNSDSRTEGDSGTGGMSIPMRGLLLALMITVASSGASTAASLLVPSSVDMAVGPSMPAPSGHRAFCEARQSECAPMQDLGPVAMTPSLWRSVWAINRGVNTEIRGRTDQEIFGREEVWTYPEGEGDCEDFALLKRRKLIEAGFPASSLLMTTVRLEDGSGHAVLTLRTGDGDYILDNLVDTVDPWRDTPYDYVRRQSSADAGKWLSIENGAGARAVPHSVAASK